MKGSCDFFFLINTENKLISETARMMDFLEYKESLHLTDRFWQDIILHPKERLEIINLYNSISEWRRKEPMKKIRLLINHKMRKSDGSYIQILRIFFPCQRICKTDGKMKEYWMNMCFDINYLKTPKLFSFDIKCNELLDTQLVNLKKAFRERIPHKNLFTSRELQIIESWARMDSIKHISSEFGISTRTVETHLKNMRKKANVSKTRDVLKIARRSGYIF